MSGYDKIGQTFTYETSNELPSFLVTGVIVDYNPATLMYYIRVDEPTAWHGQVIGMSAEYVPDGRQP